jgi:hypothetical protein
MSGSSVGGTIRTPQIDRCAVTHRYVIERHHPWLEVLVNLTSRRWIDTWDHFSEQTSS